MEKQEKKKMKFFRRLKIAVIDIDHYIDFTAEKTGKAFGFMFKLMCIMAFFIVLTLEIYIYSNYGSIEKCADKIVPEFTIAERELIIDEESAQEKNKKDVAMIMKEIEPVIISEIEDNTYSKKEMIEDIKKNEKTIAVIVGITLFVEHVMDLFLTWMMIAALTSFIGVINLGLSRVKMKYSKMFGLSIYASTVTIMLTTLYTLGNLYFGINIKSFDYLSMLISYIYITAVVYMIKSDLIKQQFELIKIATIQAKVKQDREKEKEEEKKEEKKEKEKLEKEPDKNSEEKEEKKEEKTDEQQVDDEPDGSEI